MVAKLWPWIVALVAAVVVGVWVHELDLSHQVQPRIDTLTVHIKTTDTLYRHDTLYFNRLVKVEVAKHDTVLKNLTDTVLVKQYIGLADSTIKACQSVVLTCEQRVAQRDSIIKLYKSLKPSRIAVGIVAGCGLGVAAKADCIVGVGGSWAIFR